VVVKDAAKGISAGVHEVFPGAEQRDDSFHALYEKNKVRRQLDQRAHGAIRREQGAQASRAGIWGMGFDARPVPRVHWLFV